MVNVCKRCHCEVEDDQTYQDYGEHCEGCGIWLGNALIALGGSPEHDWYNDRSAEL